jgi:hypothetical protein
MRRHDDAPASREASADEIASTNAQIESPLSGANLKYFSF